MYKWRNQVIQNKLYILAIAFSILALAACAPATAVNSPSGNTVTTVPTSVSPTNSIATPLIPETGSTSTAEPATDSNLACGGGATSANVTPSLTEGPYYKSGSPEQANLFQEGMPGTKIVITGYVYDTNCQPVANAWLDFWQADANGNYDNSGYTLRGHQYTDANGRFQLTTVVPGLYPGRTEHIHVKVQAPNGQTITSQLFFPGITQNNEDGIYNAGLLLSLTETADGLQGQYNFIVPAS
jgi:protocatechuate 3,4-dioxygenase beta subunit